MEDDDAQRRRRPQSIERADISGAVIHRHQKYNE
jgi:hypothetical protein